MPSDQEIAAILDDMQGAGPRQSLGLAARKNPEQEALLQSVAGKVGLPVESLRGFSDETRVKERQAALDREFNADRFPRTAGFLRDQQNADVAADDVANLQKHESLFGSAVNIVKQAGRMIRSAPALGLAGNYGALSALSETAGALLEPLLEIQRGLTGLEIRNPLSELGARFGQTSARFKSLSEKEAGEELKSYSPLARAAFGGLQSAGQTLLNLPLAIVGGGPVSALAPMGVQTGGSAYQQAREQGLAPLAALPFAVSQGAIEVATEQVPVTKLLQGFGLNFGLRGALRTFGVQLWEENKGEQIATALQDLNEWAALPENRDKTFGDYMNERPSAMLQTFVATLVGTATQTGAAQALDTAVNRAERQRQRQFFEALGQSATESKLRQRLPERYQQFVAEATKDGPVQEVLIPADQFTRYFQDADMSPEQVAQDLGVTNYAEARLSGGDVSVPIAEFAAKIAPTPHLAGLQDDLRLTPDQLTAREAREREANQDAGQKLVERMQKVIDENAAAKPIDLAIELVTTNVQAQLEDAGMKPETARDQATVMRGVAVLASRAYPDMDPLEAAMKVWERYNLKVTAPGLESPQGKQVDVEQGKRNAESLRDNQHLRANPKMVEEEAQRHMEALTRSALGFDDGPTTFEYKGKTYTEAKIEGGKNLRLKGADGELLLTKAADILQVEEGVPFDVPASEHVKKFFQDPLDGKRASIEFGPDRQVTISLLENRDLSSALHEMGHFYFEVLADLAADDQAAQQVRDDYATLLKFVGKDSREQVTTEDHEKIARAMEQYLREGKSPSPGLRGVFQRFRAWLSLVYKSAKDLRVTLTDDVREVFDRVLATDEEIFRAQQELQSTPMIATPALVGWTKEQFDLYSKAVADEVEQGREALQQKLMAEFAREQKKQWRDELAKVRKEVQDQSDLMPVYLAHRALTKGEMIGGDPAKLNRKAIVDRYGEDVAKALPRGIMAADGNIDAETAANFFGFQSGDDFVRSMAEMVPQSRYVAVRAQQIMAERHGDILVDGTMATRAMEALHNEKRLEVLRMELRALRQKVAEASPFVQAEQAKAKRAEQERETESRWRDAEEARRYQEARQATETAPAAYYRDLARQAIESASAREIKPNNYVVASRTASRLAFEAMSKGDYVEAAIQKQRELTNHYLYLEAVKAREEIDKILKFAKRFDNSTTREALGKAQIGGGNYLEQIDAILNRYEFRKVPIVQLERRESLAQWVEAQQKQGNDPVIDDALLNEARKVNYQSVPLTELRAVRDAIQNIEHLARLKNRLAYSQRQYDFAEAKTELRRAAETNVGFNQQLYSESARPVTERAKQVLQGLDAGILRMETLMNWLDGNDVNGPWHKYIWNPLKAAQHELNDEAEAVTAKIDALYKAMPKAWRHGLLDRVRVAGIPETITRKDLIGYALNLGNAQNREKLTAGNFGGDSAIVDRIQQQLTAEDWRFVQDTWDIVNSMWPKINAVQKRLNGVDMKKVEAVPFTAVDANGNVVAELRGGYYPLVADRGRSTVGLRQQGDLFEETYVSTSTSHGFTRDRTGAKYPLDPNFERILGQHLAQVMKDFTHREAVLAVNKILTDQDIRGVLQASLGERYEPMFRAWLKDIANDTNRGIADGMDQWSRIFTATRANVVAAVMGFKATTMISQFTSLASSLDRVGAGHLTKALLDWTRHPVQFLADVQAESGEMRHRSDNLDRDIRARLKMLVGKSTVRDDVQRFAFHGIAFADSIVAAVTWRGAYNQALAQDKSVETARLEADAAVRITQGAGDIMDQAAVQRSRSDFWRLTTMFYSFFNAQYAQGRDIGFQVDGAGDMPRALARAFLVFVVPAVVSDLILARGPGGDDDDETYLGWFARKALLSPLATVPLLRDVGQGLEMWLSGKGGDIRFTPIADVINKISRTAKRGIKDVGEDRDPDMWRYALEVAEIAGYAFGVPGTAQATASGRYLSRVAEGEEQPATPLELLYYTAVGKRKEK